MMRTHVSRRSSAVAAQDQRDEHGRSKTGQGTPHTHLQPGNGLSEPRAHPAAGHFAPSSFHEPDLITEPVCSVPAKQNPFSVYQRSGQASPRGNSIRILLLALFFAPPRCRIAGNGASHARPMAIAITAAASAIATFLALSICRRIFRSESCFVSSLSRAASMTRIIDESG
jgi:hypothetical protein